MRRAVKVPVTRRVDQVDVYALVIKMAYRRVLRMPQLPLARREIGDRVAPVNGATLRDDAASKKKRLGELGLAGVANTFRTIGH
jgi:hypothetical protein